MSAAGERGLAARLAELRAGLEGLISCFEGERFPEPSTLEAVWSRVLPTFERVRADLERRSAPAELRESVETCLRLYAVAAGVVARRRAELAAGRSTCARWRARLRGRASAASGGSCDVSA